MLTSGHYLSRVPRSETLLAVEDYSISIKFKNATHSKQESPDHERHQRRPTSHSPLFPRPTKATLMANNVQRGNTNKRR